VFHSWVRGDKKEKKLISLQKEDNIGGWGSHMKTSEDGRYHKGDEKKGRALIYHLSEIILRFLYCFAFYFISISILTLLHVLLTADRSSTPNTRQNQKITCSPDKLLAWLAFTIG
jgi:hypothetical protein